MILKKEQKSCVFHSTEVFELELDGILEFSGKSWRCVGAISNSNESFFKVNNKWYECSEENEIYECCQSFLITDGSVAVFDEINVECNHPVNKKNEQLSYTGGELEKIQNKTPIRKKDRHLDSDKRREDRHLDNKDRHLDNKDRHLDNKERHLDTDIRKKHDA